jgi:hypothetical protein
MARAAAAEYMSCAGTAPAVGGVPLKSNRLESASDVTYLCIQPQSRERAGLTY